MIRWDALVAWTRMMAAEGVRTGGWLEDGAIGLLDELDVMCVRKSKGCLQDF